MSRRTEEPTARRSADRPSGPVSIVWPAAIASPTARVSPAACVTWPMRASTVATVEVGPEPAVHRIGPLVLREARSRLGWVPRGGATVADDVLGNGDRRELSVAVGRWRWIPVGEAAETPSASRE